jgi:hypothetical protein
MALLLLQSLFMGPILDQGDWMRWLKIAQNVAQQFFCLNECTNLPWKYVGSTQIWANCELFIKLPKVNNRCPRGKKSPNLFTSRF